MTRLSIFLLALLLVFISMEVYAKPDKLCEGNWDIELIKDKNYTPWHEYTQNPPYPKNLEIRILKPRAAVFTDNRGRECSINYLNDIDEELIVIKHCLKSKHDNTVSLHYKIKCDGDHLTGKIASHKDLFAIRGVRVKK